MKTYKEKYNEVNDKYQSLKITLSTLETNYRKLQQKHDNLDGQNKWINTELDSAHLERIKVEAQIKPYQDMVELLKLALKQDE